MRAMKWEEQRGLRREKEKEGLVGRKVSMKLNPCFILQVQQADWFSWSRGQHGSLRCGDQGTSHVIPTSIITPRMHSLTSYLMCVSLAQQTEQAAAQGQV